MRPKSNSGATNVAHPKPSARPKRPPSRVRRMTLVKGPCSAGRRDHFSRPTRGVARVYPGSAREFTEQSPGIH